MLNATDLENIADHLTAIARVLRRAAQATPDPLEPPHGDPLEERVRAFLEGKTEATMGDVCGHLGLMQDQRTRSTVTRIGIVLASLGWRVATQQGAQRVRVYRPLYCRGTVAEPVYEPTNASDAAP